MRIIIILIISAINLQATLHFADLDFNDPAGTIFSNTNDYNSTNAGNISTVWANENILNNMQTDGTGNLVWGYGPYQKFKKMDFYNPIRILPNNTITSGKLVFEVNISSYDLSRSWDTLNESTYTKGISMLIWNEQDIGIGMHLRVAFKPNGALGTRISGSLSSNVGLSDLAQEEISVNPLGAVLRNLNFYDLSQNTIEGYYQQSYEEHEPAKIILRMIIDLDNNNWEIVYIMKLPTNNDNPYEGLETERTFTLATGSGITNIKEFTLYNNFPNEDNSIKWGDDTLLEGQSGDFVNIDSLKVYGENFNDSDSDGLSDIEEVNIHLTNPNAIDSDSDGLSDGDEVNIHLTNPNAIDSDSDGLIDGAEVIALNTNPNNGDSDGDSLLDSVEVQAGTNPNLSDTDSDGLDDFQEITYNTNPNIDDTSGDGLKDGVVVSAGFDPTVDYTNLKNIISQSIQDLRPGSTMIEISGNQATVQLQMEESSDLRTWEDTGTPATMTIPADTDTKFFRFKMAE